MSAHRRDRVCDMSFGVDGRRLGVDILGNAKRRELIGGIAGS